VLKIRGDLDSTTGLGLFLAGILLSLGVWAFLSHSTLETHKLTGRVGEDLRVVVAEAQLVPETPVFGDRRYSPVELDPNDPEASEPGSNEFLIESRSPLTLRYHPSMKGQEVNFGYTSGDEPIVSHFVLPQPGTVLKAFKELLVGPAFRVTCPKPDCASNGEAGAGFVHVSAATGDAIEAYRVGRMEAGAELQAPGASCPTCGASLDEELAVALPGHEFRAGMISTIRRTLLGFLLAVAVSLPLGVLAGAFPHVKQLFGPLTIAGGYSPPVVLVTLTFAVNGVLITNGVTSGAAGEVSRVAFFLLLVVSFWLYPAVVSEIEAVDEIYINTAYTCGASRWQVITQVLWPVAKGNIWQHLRACYAIGWAFISLAEGFGPARGVGEYGVGFFLVLMQRRHMMDNFYAAVFVIIITGILFDYLFKVSGRKLFPYREVD
jgi:ABC-type nitrate/sulfonate/bicarbonate transport system permease component